MTANPETICAMFDQSESVLGNGAVIPATSKVSTPVIYAEERLHIPLGLEQASARCLPGVYRFELGSVGYPIFDLLWTLDFREPIRTTVETKNA